MRKPEDIIGHDAAQKLYKSGYKIVPALEFMGMHIVFSDMVPDGTIEFHHEDGRVDRLDLK